jgi:hypothetical protein
MRKKKNAVSPQMNADKHRYLKATNVFICVHLRSSVDDTFLISLFLSLIFS